MSREFSDQIVEILRRDILRGSTRTIDHATSLGEGGVGLDSLSLVELVAALEKHFDTTIPDDIWIDRGQLTVDGLADVIRQQLGEAEPAFRPPRVLAEVEHGTQNARSERMKAVFDERGVLGGTQWVAAKAVKKISESAYRQDSFHILSFDLKAKTVARPKTRPDVTFRLAGIQDMPSVNGIFTAAEREHKLKRFRERVANGYLCYTAWVDRTMVALDWVTDKPDFEPTTGLTIAPQAGACYGLDLREHPDYKSRGVGLALLEYCLHDCRERGYRTQYAIVDATNKKMLMAAVQLLGFTTVGRIRSRTVLGKTSTRWECNGLSSDSNQLVLAP